MDNNQIIKYNNGQLIKAGNYIAITEKLLSLGPQLDANYYFNRARQKCDLANFLGAIEDYSKAIELDPQLNIAYNGRGFTKDDLKDYIGAIEDYTKAIEIDPEFAIAYNNRGITRRNLNDYIGAIEDYDKAIEINPRYALAYYNRGVTKQRISNKSFCDDWKKAEALGYKPSSDMIRRYCEF